jgi:hypothetical protein
VEFLSICGLFVTFKADFFKIPVKPGLPGTHNLSAEISIEIFETFAATIA